MIQGHRGSSHRFPENTLLAYRRAVEEGAHGIEVDVRQTRDGAHVIMHDPSVERTTNGMALVKELTLREITALDAGGWKRADFGDRADTRVPTLSDVLDSFHGRPVRIILQLKLEETEALDVVKIVSRRNMIGQCVFFAPMSVINTIKAQIPEAITQNDGMPGPDGYREQLQNAIRFGHHAVSVRATAITQSMVDEIHAAGLLVHASYLSADYDASIERLVALGVDQVLGNDCAAMVAAATRFGQ